MPHYDIAIVGAGPAGLQAALVLALGYQDTYPDVEGFGACWGKTIIPCPFCDGYENRDRVWGLVAASDHTLKHLPTMFKNWTDSAKIFLMPTVNISQAERASFAAQGIAVYDGAIMREWYR